VRQQARFALVILALRCGLGKAGWEGLALRQSAGAVDELHSQMQRKHSQYRWGQ